MLTINFFKEFLILLEDEPIMAMDLLLTDHKITLPFRGKGSYEHEVWSGFLWVLNGTTKYPNLNDKLSKALILWFTNANKANYQKEWQFDSAMKSCFALAEVLNPSQILSKLVKVVWERMDQILLQCKELEFKNGYFNAVFDFLLFRALDSRILHKLKELEADSDFEEIAKDRLKVYFSSWKNRSTRRSPEDRYYPGRKRKRKKWRREKLNAKRKYTKAT